MRVRYLGHSTILVELDGVRLLTDPLLRTRVAHLTRRVPPVSADLDRLDAILVSHAHYDHLDLRSLERVGRSTRVVVPRGVGGTLRRRRFDVVELSEGDELPVRDVTILATYAEHDGNRPPLVRGASALGYALLGSRRVFFAGDTDLFPGMEGLVPDLDLAFIPVAGWGPKLGPGHLDPERAAEALVMLRPRVAIPIHWGTFAPLHRRASADFLRRPAEEFVRAARKRAPDVEVRVLNPGEAYTE